MTPNDVRLLVQAIATRSEPTPMFAPATVVGVDTANAVVTVQIDGAEWGSDVDVRPLVADTAVGDRVMVMYDPPRGGYVVGWIGRPQAAGEVVVYQELTTLASAVTNAAPQNWTTIPITFRPRRLYRIDFAGTVTRVSATGGNPRAQLVLFLDTIDTDGSTLATQLQSTSIILTSVVTRGALSKSYFQAFGNTGGTLRLQAREADNSGSVDFLSPTGAPSYVVVTDVGPSNPV
jgi:hypothetical protein